MSQEDLDLQALSRRLDHAFGSARPRPGFAAELQERLERRRPWWRRASAATLGGALAATAAVGVAGFIVVAGLSAQHGAGGTASSLSAAPAGGAAFGRIPRPPAVPVGSAAFAPQGPPTQAQSAYDAPVYSGRVDATVTASPPAADPTVSRVDNATSQSQSARYPLAAAADLAAAARAQAAARVPSPDGHVPQVTLDRAVVSTASINDGRYTYLEPVILYSGGFDYQGRHYEVRVLVPAVDARDLR